MEEFKATKNKKKKKKNLAIVKLDDSGDIYINIKLNGLHILKLFVIQVLKQTTCQFTSFLILNWSWMYMLLKKLLYQTVI
ncbi:hypothetical protein Scep_009892 [Stephania cephalantha]|uniref:Uncharacterized protein n=1 Tax=Stephania cephalantha TaxID=152367 RepID=A0AAP0JTZ1_9MAGN